ncbi:MAG: hypothetical protein WA172_00050 [Terriglobales bacterium]
MSRVKSILALFLLTAIVCIVPQAFAANPAVEVVMAGSSAIWQTAAVAAFNNGLSLVGGTNTTCHWTSKSNAINLTDTRPTLLGGVANNDAGTIWIVWDVASPATCVSGAPALHVWADDKVDSVVGDRCYFARPQCTETGTSNGSTGTLDVAGNQINFAGTPWGNNSDTVLPANVIAVFTGAAGTLNKVGAAATDIRVEDANFAVCRANSSLGAGAVNTGDALDGLGYNSANAPGACPPAFGTATLAQLVATSIKSGVLPATGATANPLAFNISGKDPFSGTTEPAYKQIDVGGEPMVFVVARSNNLKGVHNVSSEQLATVFSGTLCDASVFGPQFSGGLNIFLREPLSGTMNTTEATVFRRPTVNQAGGSPALGLSQEANVDAAVNNPLQGQSGTCVNNPSGKGARYRGIGTGEVTNNGVFATNNANGGAFPTAQDGVAYTFFSFGNVKKGADSDSFGYLTLHGYDPIFSSYGNQATGARGANTPFDPSQPSNGAVGGAGELPGAADLPAGCEGGAGNFPCSEDIMWAPNPQIESATHTALSFPNVRLGLYPAWSILRVVSDSGAGGQYAALSMLVKNSNKYAVGYVPDYIPFSAVPAQTVGSHSVPADPGMKILRSHYQQMDGAGNLLGPAPVNTGAKEAGGDMGGQILFTLTTNGEDAIVNQVQGPGGFQVRP